MLGDHDSEAILKSVAKLNAHVASLDQDSDTALLINEIFTHLNQINEETEKVIVLSKLIKEKKNEHMEILGPECQGLLFDFYVALLKKVHVEILDELIKSHKGALPDEESMLLMERNNIHDHYLNEVIKDDYPHHIPLNLDKKIVMLEGMLHKQQELFASLDDSDANNNIRESVNLAIQRIDNLQNVYKKIYESQQSGLTNFPKLPKKIVTDKLTKDKQVVDKANALALHIETLQSTIGNDQPRTMRMNEIKKELSEQGNIVLKVIQLGKILETENESEVLLKPDLLILKQYHAALLQLADVELLDELIGSEKVEKLKEPWLSIERNHFQARILSQSSLTKDPCKNILFHKSRTNLEQNQKKYVLLQALKQQVESTDCKKIQKGEWLKQIESIACWEIKYKEKLAKDPGENEEVLVTAQGEENQMAPAISKKRSWHIWDFLFK